MDKKEFRKIVYKKRKELDTVYVQENSNIIFDKLKKIDEFNKAKNVFIYASYNNEVDTFEIIKYLLNNNVNVALPRVINKGIMNFYYIKNIDELERSCMNIMEPIPRDSNLADVTEKSIMIAPGVAFDNKKNRIGYGGGFYDRYLQNKNMFSIAIAFDFQIFDSLPIEEHDKKVNIIITQSKCIR